MPMKPACTAILLALALASTTAPAQTAPASAQAQAGRKIFFDGRLSNPPGTSCASCHNPQQGWAGNNASKSGVAAGSEPGRLGGRNTPTIGYIAFVPSFHIKKEDGKAKAVGGLFWDGRANTLEEQARGPLFSKMEMNLAGEADLAGRLRTAPYAAELRAAYALADSASDAQWAQAAFSAIGAFQRAPEVAPFSSKYDAVLRGEAKLSDAEARGLRLFAGAKKGNCAACHSFNAKSKNPAEHLFTDFTYDNLGLPRNAAIPANADAKQFDLGLCGPTRETPKGLGNRVCGAFKVPTLRNAAQRPFYFHNGSFTDLAEVVRFYVERDTHPEKWYPKDGKGKTAMFNDLPRSFARNVNRDEAPYDRKRGQKPRLNDAEIADVVAFIKTLDDGFKP
jgi:cytochrome c peroxidase